MSGTMYFGPSKADKLVQDIAQCVGEWDDDPAYNDIVQKLREVQRGLDVLTQSPGARQTARLQPPNQSGQYRPVQGDEA